MDDPNKWQRKVSYKRAGDGNVYGEDSPFQSKRIREMLDMRDKIIGERGSLQWAEHRADTYSSLSGDAKRGWTDFGMNLLRRNYARILYDQPDKLDAVFAQLDRDSRELELDRDMIESGIYSYKHEHFERMLKRALAAERREDEAAALEGEPVIPKGVVRDVLAKNRDISGEVNMREFRFNGLFNGYPNQAFSSMGVTIPIGDEGLIALGDGRVGRTIEVIGLEYRLRAWNSQYEKRTLQVGMPGALPTYITVPKAKIDEGDLETTYYGTDGLPALQFCNQQDPVILTDVVINAGVVAGDPAGRANLEYSWNNHDVTIRPEYTKCDFPGYQGSHPIEWQYGHTGGTLPEVRIIIAEDRSTIAKSAVVGSAVPCWSDLTNAPASPPFVSPVMGVYNEKNLSRFRILHDTTWEPKANCNSVLMVQPAFEVAVKIVYPQSSESGFVRPVNDIIIGICAAEALTEATYPFSVDGMVRIFFKDT